MNHSYIYKTIYKNNRYSYSYLSCYNLNLFYYINNRDFYMDDITIYENYSFIINSNKIKEYIKNENQFCLIKFQLTKSKNNNFKNPVIELNIHSIENNLPSSLPNQTNKNIKPTTNFLEKNLELIIIISVSVFIFIIIIIIIVCACKKGRNKIGRAHV